ncbi:uncharacterized protein LOC141679953 [Apium graveolens]|uniref:uncharacterized protein LOC141679953 n=1 Tax=Apium graveolens TaxID=4045 RepID=UPI003D799557
MQEWNKPQILGHLLKVITNSDTLWATWVNKTALKGKNFWTTKLPTDCSWIWRKILKCRILALQFVSFRIGTGESISLWFDPWWNNACLASNRTSNIISQCGMQPGDKLSAIIHNGTWILPRANSRSHHLEPMLVDWLSTFVPPNLNTGPDLLLWDGCDATKIKTWDVWNSIRLRGTLVSWYRVVWHKLRINRYAHHQWLSCHGRLYTLSRLHKFGLVDNQQCYLCICGRETGSHIFLHCSYSKWVLCNLMSPLGINIVGESRLGFLTYLADLHDKPNSTVALCYAQIFCYHIWRERNARAHDSGVLGPRNLLKGINRDAYAKLQSSTWFSKLVITRPYLVPCNSL